jgi:hypothetical protein
MVGLLVVALGGETTACRRLSDAAETCCGSWRRVTDAAEACLSLGGDRRRVEARVALGGVSTACRGSCGSWRRVDEAVGRCRGSRLVVALGGVSTRLSDAAEAELCVRGETTAVDAAEAVVLRRRVDAWVLLMRLGGARGSQVGEEVPRRLQEAVAVAVREARCSRGPEFTSKDRGKDKR